MSSSPPERTALQAALDEALGVRPAVPPPQAVPTTRASVRAAAAALVQRNRTRQRSTAGAPSPVGSPPSSLKVSLQPPRKRQRSVPAQRAEVQLRLTDLQALGTLAQQLREQQALERAREQARREAAARRVAEQELFTRAVGPVTALRNPNLAHVRAEAPEPLPLQLWLDEERALVESISDDFDVSTLLDTDDQLSYRRQGIGVEITRRLRAGHWSIQHQLDLHGLRTDEAREALGEFIRQAHKHGLRCVRVVHGKGLGSPGKTPVLKSRVQRWLVQKNEVLAFVQARPAEGGAGALVVLLQPTGARKA